MVSECKRGMDLMWLGWIFFFVWGFNCRYEEVMYDGFEDGNMIIWCRCDWKKEKVLVRKM